MTRMLMRYILTFLTRLGIFIAVLALYLHDRELLKKLMTQPIKYGISFIHILWAVFMIIMLQHIFPNNRLSMALRRQKEETYVPVEGYSEYELLKYVQDQNVKAWNVLLVWLLGNAGVGALYLFKIITDSELLMLSVFYYLSDYICILFFCPFQTGIMKNKCCVNCRIYDWGHFMMFTPMLFIRNFFSWSLFFTSAVVLIHWEIIYARHPERFWEGSNARIKCANCRDKICQFKKPLDTRREI